jgi:uncharacterized membrane protein
MTTNPNMSTKFRAELRNELSLWTQQGVLSDESAKQLASIYQLDNLKHESSNLLSAVIFTIGGLLLGGGLISFVAANWDATSTPVKLTLLVTALLSFHIVGRWLWQTTHWRRLGHALVFCGCLVFGANIGLVAQIFHISSTWYSGFGAWALGSLAMAWAFRSWIIGVLTLFTSFLWFAGHQGDSYDFIAGVYPLIIAAALLPLAWMIRSRVLYTGTVIAIVASACVLAGNHGSGRQLLLTMAAGAVFMWTLGELQRAAGWRTEFANLTAGFGLGGLAITAHVWSFHVLWSPSPFGTMRAYWAIVFVALTIAGVGLWFAMRRRQARPLGLTIGVLTAGGILCASSLMARADAANGESLFTITTNFAALIAAAVIIAVSLIDERRAVFWLGSLYLVQLILARFLEYNTSLLVKSAAFLACGVAVIVAGVSYEQFLRRNRPRPVVEQPLTDAKGRGGRIFE